jgi:hypothetical protein
MKIRIVDPTTFPDWNERIAAFPDVTVFHTANWAQVLKEAYGYEPVYLVETDNNTFTGVLPLFHVQSILTGRRGVSIPFTDVCPPLFANSGTVDRMFSEAVQVGCEKGWKTIEFRGLPKTIFGETPPPSQQYMAHELRLTGTYDQIAARFRSSTNRNIRTARAYGVVASIGKTYEAVCAFYRLNCMTRRDHGIPPQPFSFFKALHRHVIQEGLGIVVLGNYHDITISGAMFLMFNGNASYKYGASDRQFLPMRSNNLVIGEGIRYLAENGCGKLHFGRTDLQHDGLLQYKRGWGTTWDSINYNKLDLIQNSFITQNAKAPAFSTCLSKMPIPLLRLFGKVAYRHAG